MSTNTPERSSAEQDNAALVHRFLQEVVNEGRAESIDDLMSADYVMHGGSLGDYVGLPAYKQFLAANGAGAFTDMHLEVTQTLTEGDHVYVLFTNSGTNTGEFMGMAATGRYAKWNGTALYRIENDRIAESTYVEDIFHLLLQLGITHIPTA